MKKHVLFSILFAVFAFPAFAQDDLLKMLESNEKKQHLPVIAMFKGHKLINIHTNETVSKHNLDVRITHLFGNMGTESGGGVHNLYGVDQSADIRIGFHYGVTNKLMVGIARMKRNENLEALVKYNIIHQTTDNHFPLAISFYSNVTYSIREHPEITSSTYRYVYCSQLIFGRKFSQRFSLVLIPTFVHRNFVAGDDENNTFSLSGGFRFKFTPSASVIFDYSHTLGRYNLLIPHYDILGAGIEIETGGHVFTVMFTNAIGISESDYLVNSLDTWKKGGIKLSFNISRMFALVKESN